jgi:hypothetical protein
VIVISCELLLDTVRVAKRVTFCPEFFPVKPMKLLPPPTANVPFDVQVPLTREYFAINPVFNVSSATYSVSTPGMPVSRSAKKNWVFDPVVVEIPGKLVGT